MNSSSFKRSSLLAALLLTGTALAGESRFASYASRQEASSEVTCTDRKAELLQEAKAQALALNEEQISTLTAETATVVATNIAGFEKVPATDYAQGVDAAFLYLDAPETGLPAGHYRVSVQANPDDSQVGKYRGIASLIDKDGKEVARLPTVTKTFGPVALRSAGVGLQAHVGLQQQMLDWNLTRFRKTIIVVIVHSWGVTVIDLFNTDYSDYY
ncbi:hypothetical protein D7V97_27815 [Corallococcus sp. CA053C]|uniref:hypothetical protein n=1 Tax=Corallococcus sp. CA053C TaxID=2316732 RepID=UPI000EA03E19|nr:hypothetical protein [Corallococcus sp. CA053C]RKH02475.1 hypothetical protein D7V97_27815 [Corallococcus sp. CA053C]